MNKKIIFFLILWLLILMLLINYGYLQEVEKKEIYTFITGNKYLLDIPDGQKGAYVMGLLDMYSYLTYYFDSESYPDFRGKIERMTGIQIAAIFDNYLEEHPEEWHFSGAMIFYSAINDL
jgi:hypothetical protein